MNPPDCPVSSPGDETEIICQVRQGRTEGFQSLVERYLPAVLGLLRCLGAPDAMIEDVAQETFLRAYQNLGRFDPLRPFRPWLLVIARNLLTDMLRKEHREHLLSLTADRSALEGGPEEVVIAREAASQLLEAMSETQRFLVEMRVIHGHSFAEIAEMIGVGEGAVRMRFCRLLEQVRLQATVEDNHHG